MVPFIVLAIATLLLKAIGAAGVTFLNDWTWCLRGGLALMFLLTASAHWGKRRADLVAMVPGVFPRPDLMVSATGVLEILGAVGLLIPAIAPVAAVCLAMLLIALFPANRLREQRKQVGPVQREVRKAVTLDRDGAEVEEDLRGLPRRDRWARRRLAPAPPSDAPSLDVHGEHLKAVAFDFQYL